MSEPQSFPYTVALVFATRYCMRSCYHDLRGSMAKPASIPGFPRASKEQFFRADDLCCFAEADFFCVMQAVETQLPRLAAESQMHDLRLKISGVVQAYLSPKPLPQLRQELEQGWRPGMPAPVVEMPPTSTLRPTGTHGD